MRPKTEKVKPTLKVQPKSDVLIATSKIVEALDPIWSFQERRRALIAALSIIGEETLLQSIFNTK